MQRDLSRLTRTLQKETCPQRVHDEVRRRISTSAREASRSRFRYVIPVGATMALALICAVSIWKGPADASARRDNSPGGVQQNRLQVANQAAEALEFIGSIVARARDDSQKVISDRAVPPLRNSLLEAKNKLIPQIEL